MHTHLPYTTSLYNMLEAHLNYPYSAIAKCIVNIKWLKFALAPLNTSFAKTL